MTPGKRVFAGFLGFIFCGIGLAIIFAFETYWGRVVMPEREKLATAITIDCNTIGPQNDGKLVRVTGPLVGAEDLADSQFGVTAHALRLRRRVWMFQWQQSSPTPRSSSSYSVNDTTVIKTKSYNFYKVWSEEIIDSKGFKKPVAIPVPGTPLEVQPVSAGHVNPHTMAISSRTVAAAKATLGAFTVAPEILALLNNFETVPLTPNNLAAVPEPFRSMGTISSNFIYFAADPAKPAIGDLKVAFESAPPAVASIIARQSGLALIPCAVTNGAPLALLQAGDFSTAQMVRQFSKDNSAQRAIVWGMACVPILLGAVLLRHAITAR